MDARASDPAPSAPANLPPREPASSAPRTRLRLLGGGGGLAVAAVAAFVFLGSSSNQLANPIAQAATLSSSIGGYKLRMAFDMSIPGLASPLSGTGTGTVDSRDRAASMSIAMDLGSLPQAAQALGSSILRLSMVVEGTTIYVKLPAAAMSSLSTGKPWVKFDLGKVGGLKGLSSLPGGSSLTDPAQMLDLLRSESSGIANLGSQTVDGIATTHYRADLDLSRVGVNLPAAGEAKLQQLLSQFEHATGLTNFPVDVWVDAHHLVRREVASLRLRLPTGGSMQENVAMDITDYGPQPRPAAPSAAQVQDLSGALGGLGG